MDPCEKLAWLKHLVLKQQNMSLIVTDISSVISPNTLLEAICNRVFNLTWTYQMATIFTIIFIMMPVLNQVWCKWLSKTFAICVYNALLVSVKKDCLSGILNNGLLLHLSDVICCILNMKSILENMHLVLL